MTNLSTIFGEPNKGIHKYSIFGIAIVDVIATIIIAYLLIILYNKNNCQTVDTISGTILLTIILLILSYPIHKIFGVKTRGTQKIDLILNN